MNSELEITRTFKDDSFFIVYEKGVLKDYEKRILAGKEIDNLLRMRFIASENKDTVYYDISAYTPLKNVVVLDLFEAINIIQDLITILIKAEDYLIEIGNICLDYEWIYYDTNKKDIYLSYLPRKDTPQWQLSIFKFVADFAIIYNSEEAQPYFETLKNYLEESHRSLQDLFLKICDLKREAHLSM